MPTLAETIAQAVGEAIAKALADDKQLLEDIAKVGGDAASNGLLGDVEDVVSIFSNILGDIPIVGSLLSDISNPIAAVEKKAGRFGRGFGLGYVIGYAVWTWMQPLFLPIQHAVAASVTNEVWDPQTAAQLVVKGLIPKNQGDEEAGSSGLDNPHFDALVDAAKTYPALGEALRLLNLKQLTEADVHLFLQRQCVPEQYWTPLIQLKRELLSSADLALANLRGEMDDATLQGYADQLGMTADDMAVLIANTGEPPGTMQLLEAYRRRYIGVDRLQRGVRQSRVRDEWFDVIEKLRYQPMSAIDAIRALVQNHLPEAVARQKAQDAGLLPEDFDPLYQTFGNPISPTGALELYHRGQMPLAEVKQAIRESRYKDKYVDNIVELGRRLIPFRTINTILAHGVWTKDQGVKYLMELGYTEADATALVSTATTAKVASIKSITEAQILELYEAKAITQTQAEELLKSVGYDKTESGYILDATEAKATIAEQKRAVSAVRASYMADRITIQEAGQQLDALQVLAPQRDKLISQWKIERAAEVKTLSPAQWATAAYYGLVTYDYAVNKLKALGYSQTEAELVVDVRLHGLQPGQTQGSLER